MRSEHDILNTPALRKLKKQAGIARGPPSGLRLTMTQLTQRRICHLIREAVKLTQRDGRKIVRPSDVTDTLKNLGNFAQ